MRLPKAPRQLTLHLVFQPCYVGVVTGKNLSNYGELVAGKNSSNRLAKAATVLHDPEPSFSKVEHLRHSRPRRYRCTHGVHRGFTSLRYSMVVIEGNPARRIIASCLLTTCVPCGVMIHESGSESLLLTAIASAPHCRVVSGVVRVHSSPRPTWVCGASVE